MNVIAISISNCSYCDKLGASCVTGLICAAGER